jgi:hypothetical protein
MSAGELLPLTACKPETAIAEMSTGLSSGKSWAMAMSLSPMSFHLFNISSDRERVGRGD